MRKSFDFLCVVLQELLEAIFELALNEPVQGVVGAFQQICGVQVPLDTMPVREQGPAFADILLLAAHIRVVVLAGLC